ncbi:hypothetical protein PGB90_009738 [Kerria lacca]
MSTVAFLEVLNIRMRGPHLLCIILLNTSKKCKRAENSNPSITYCPLSLYGMRAINRERPYSSVVDPTFGRSIITSQIIPPINKNYNNRTSENIVISEDL